MKFDKESVIGIAACILLLMAWTYYFKPKAPNAGKKEYSNTENASKDGPIIEKTSRPISDAVIKEDVKPGLKTQDPSEIEKPDSQTQNDAEQKKEDAGYRPDLPVLTVSNDDVQISIDQGLGSVSQIILKKYLRAKENKGISLERMAGPGALAVSLGDGWKLQNVNGEKKGEEILLSRVFSKDGQTLNVKQSWILAPDYIVNYKLEIINESESAVNIPEITISSGEMPTTHRVAGNVVRREYQSIDTCLAENKVVKSKTIGKKPFSELQENPALWTGVSNKYFACILIPDKPFINGNMMVSYEFKEEKEPDKTYFVLESMALIKDWSIEPGKDFTENIRYFAGPKEITLLKKTGDNTSEIMHLGWKWLEPISQLLLVCLVWLKKICGSYGMSIIVLTVIVRLLFWPVTERANKSMKAMQKIQPLVQEIREKYKSDPQKMNAKTMQLYKEHKVNPLGGCLPIVLQIPVFFALYNTLDGAVELRHSSFLWAHDLAAPDTIFTISLGTLAQLPVNPLMLLMTITMFIQQKLTPTTADPAQQKIFMLMPFIMLVMLYSLPSGLTLYWTVSQMLSILQLLINKYRDKLSEQNKDLSYAKT